MMATTSDTTVGGDFLSSAADQDRPVTASVDPNADILTSFEDAVAEGEASVSGPMGDDADKAGSEPPKKKRRTKRAKLDGPKLLDEEKGIPRILREFPHIQFKDGAKTETHNFNLLMSKYVEWADRLFPQYTFADFVAKTEELNKGSVKEFMSDMRFKFEVQMDEEATEAAQREHDADDSTNRNGSDDDGTYHAEDNFDDMGPSDDDDELELLRQSKPETANVSPADDNDDEMEILREMESDLDQTPRLSKLEIAEMEKAKRLARVAEQKARYLQQRQEREPNSTNKGSLFTSSAYATITTSYASTVNMFVPTYTRNTSSHEEGGQIHQNSEQQIDTKNTSSPDEDMQPPLDDDMPHPHDEDMPPPLDEDMPPPLDEDMPPPLDEDMPPPLDN